MSRRYLQAFADAPTTTTPSTASTGAPTAPPIPEGESAEAHEAADLQSRWEELAAYTESAEQDLRPSRYLTRALGVQLTEVGELLMEARARLDQPMPAHDREQHLATIRNILDGAEMKLDRILRSLDHYDRYGFVRGAGASWVPAIAVTALYAGLLWAQKRMGGSSYAGMGEASDEEWEKALSSGDYELKDVADCGCNG
jgi:hypothetical protein